MSLKTQLQRMVRIACTHISPTFNTKVTYLGKFHRPIDLEDPKTLDEKIQWLKLNTYLGDPLVTQCADKYAVRQYVEKCGCQEILNDLYYSWDSVDEIKWDELPDKFVIKWNFGCGQNLICRDKSKLDEMETKKLLKEWRKKHKTTWKLYSEMQYKGITPKLVCEKLIETDTGDLPLDYKLYCFNGQAKYVMLCTERESGHPKYYFFDRERNLVRLNKRGLAAPEGFTIPMPEGYDKLFEYADKLSAPFPFVRADFYLEKGQVIFGELTFTPCGGYDVNIPREQNEYLGSQVKLDIDNNAN